MITIVYSTHKDENYNNKFRQHLLQTVGLKNVQILEYQNNNEFSLTEVYNRGLDESLNDVVVFCHNDIDFETKSWGTKLLKHFEKTNFGILGVAGTTQLPESGMWWKNKKKMIGIVNHEHQGKKWVSKYSEGFGNDVYESVIVDGLFISVNKKIIKKTFNEEFKGFHFYDISFCFENHLEGIKIGVISNIRLTHKSIGQTNELWEKNRELFVEKYKTFLPKKIPINKNKKIKVLISCLFFKTFTGSEIYVYELAKNLKKNNCDVTVISQIGGPLTDLSKKQGIKCLSFDELPGFKIGDGKWGINTLEGFKVTEKGKLYKVSEVDFDLIHIQHKPVAEMMIQFYPEIDKIYSIHSEVIDLESPIKHDSIKKYIAVRPEIKEYIVNKFQIPESDVEIIYNPVDNEKFKPRSVKDENYVLFVGTIDYLRKQTIIDLIKYSKENNKELWLVGEDKSNYLSEVLENSHVKHFTSRWNVENFIQKCSETSGIQLGRTTIEGWLCNKPSWIYNVDSNGNILSKNKFDPPSDIDKYYSSNVCKQIKEEYLKIL